MALLFGVCGGGGGRSSSLVLESESDFRISLGHLTSIKYDPTRLVIVLIPGFIIVLTVYKILESFHLVITIPNLLSTSRIYEPRSASLLVGNLSDANHLRFPLHMPTPLIFHIVAIIASN